MSLTSSVLSVFFVSFMVIYLYVKLNNWYRSKQIDDFHKKNVFITGTDTGFGKRLALELDRKGLRVYAGCYTQEGEEQLRQESSERLRTLRIDVTKRETILAAREFIEKDLGPKKELWGLVNNAGIMRGVLLDFCTMEDFRETMEVNFFGVINTTETFSPLIKKSRGRIVNVVSICGRVSMGSEPYTCSKHAVDPYTDGLRRSMKTFGVDVATIEPGFHETEITEKSFWTNEVERTWKRLPETTRDEYGEDFKNKLQKSITRYDKNLITNRFNKIEDVIDAISHALRSTRPKKRYVCGKDAYIWTRLWPFSPEWFQDTIFRYILQYHEVRVIKV